MEDIIHPKLDYIKQYFISEKQKGVSGRIQHTLDEWYYLIVFPLHKTTPKRRRITKKQFLSDMLDYDSWFTLDKYVIRVESYLTRCPPLWIFTAIIPDTFDLCTSSNSK